MQIEEIKRLTKYACINDLLAEWTQSVRYLLGDELVGLYLSGSLAYGDFVPGRSDIDLQAVVRAPLASGQLTGIERLHRELDAHHPEWEGRTECSYVPLRLMSEILPPAATRPWWGFSHLYPEAPPGNEWTINHYFLARCGVTLDGIDAKSIVPKIDIRTVRMASARDLFAEWEPKSTDAEWLKNDHYQSYLVLNLCRILHTVIGAGPGSKTEAARWTKTNFPEWTSLIDVAQRWEYGMVMKRRNDALEFLKFAVETVKRTNILGMGDSASAQGGA